MKAPNLPSLSDRRPVPQDGQAARIDAVLARRKNVRRQHLVERVEHLADAQVLDARRLRL